MKTHFWCKIIFQIQLELM